MTDFLFMPWEPAHWFAAGGVLLVLEIILPGVMMVWFGAAAVLTGLVLLAVAMPSEAQLALFGALSLLSALVFRRVWRRHKPQSDALGDRLNNRGKELAGRRAVVSEEIVNGRGAVRIGDARWAALSERDCKVGESVVIEDVESASLRVHPAAGPDPSDSPDPPDSKEK